MAALDTIAHCPVLLVLLVAALALALPFYWHRNLTTATSPEKSIAVLPFENASKDPNAEYLSEGISEALINSLTELQRLRVIARSTAFQYKGKDVDPRRVGRELQVAAVLTGRVRQSQDALSIQVDLVDAVTGAQLWGEEYVRKISDVVAVKQAIAREVTAKLKLKLTGEEQRRLAKGDSTNTEAYRSYLRGRYFWNKRTPDGIKQAIAAVPAGDRARSKFRSWLRRIGGLLHWTDVLQFCRAARSHAKGKRIGNKGAGIG